MYRLQPVSLSVDDSERRRDESLRVSLGVFDEDGANRLSIASLNAENLFDLADDPDADDASNTPTKAALETKLAKLAMTVVDVLGAPEIVLLQEIENQNVLQLLTARVNRLLENKTSYRGSTEGSSDRRGIENAFLWDENRVELVGIELLDGPDVEAAFGRESRSPGREPLVGRFRIEGQGLMVIANHFKNKGGDDPIFGSRQPPRRVTEDQRVAQARALRRALDERFVEDPNARILVGGDFNDFPFAEPGEGDDHPLGILEGMGEDRLENLILRAGPRAYTYVFQGNSQVLDHMLVSEELSGHVERFAIAHINAAIPASLSRDGATPLRSSDHDPLLVVFSWP